VIPDPCDPDPCENNGTCQAVSGISTCVCPPEYTGPTCEGKLYIVLEMCMTKV